MSSQQQTREVHPSGDDAIEQFLDLQKQELEIKQQEISFAHKELESNTIISKLGIETSERDREKQRQHNQKVWQKAFWIVFWAVVALFVFGITALFTGHAELLKELGTGAIISATSFAAGYGFRQQREQKDSSNS